MRLLLQALCYALLGVSLAWLPLWAQAQQQSEALSLQGPATRDVLAGHLDAFTDPTWDITVEQVATTAAANFKPVQGDTVNFGYTKSRVWIRAKLRNDTLDQTDWLLHFHENFKQYFDLYLLREGGSIETLMSLTPESSFDDRPIAYPQMVAEFRAAPGEEVTLLFSLWSEGSSFITLSVETPESFAVTAARQTAKNFVFYGMLTLLVCIGLAALFYFRQPLFFFYSGYASSALIYVMHADGNTFQFLWPNAPGFNNMASVVAGTSLIVFGSFFARSFLKTAERHRVMDWLLIGVVVATLGATGALFFSNPQLLKKVLVLLSLAAVLAFTLSAIVAAIQRFREVRFYLLAWVGATVSAVLLNLSHIFGVNIPQEVVHDSMRVVMVFDALMMGLAIGDRYNHLRQSRQRVLEANLRATQRSLGLNARLTELEQQYKVAVDMAEQQNQQIQNTVHDLSQPLHALRLNVKNMSEGRMAEPGDAAQIDEAFTYLERLVAEQLRVVPGAAPAMPAEGYEDAKELSVRDVLTSIHQMFSSDAAEKGLEFRFVPASHDARVEPLALMRVITNLVANAIKYTQTGGVLLGSRRAGGRLLIEVHDTGPGMSTEAFTQATARSERLSAGDEIDGHGYGLAIVAEIARAHDFDVSLSRLRKSGTGVVVSVPLA